MILLFIYTDARNDLRTCVYIYIVIVHQNCLPQPLNVAEFAKIFQNR